MARQPIQNFYVQMKSLINSTGELYHLKSDIEYLDADRTVDVYNKHLVHLR